MDIITTARNIFSNSNLVFNEVKIPPRVGWDGVVSQILDSATDGMFASLIVFLFCQYQLRTIFCLQPSKYII